MEEAELDTRVFVGTAIAAWEELYLTQEAELRKEADSLTHSLQTHTHHTQNVLAGMRSTAETHELVIAVVVVIVVVVVVVVITFTFPPSPLSPLSSYSLLHSFPLFVR